MSKRRGNLQPAHRGYRYQDIATAYVLVRGVVERYDEVIVDRKQVKDDRIDDLEVRAGGRRVRRQFKSSLDATRPLSENDFVASTSSLRIDRLVLTHVRAGMTPADESRLCATWAPPVANDPLAKLLEPVTAAPTLEGWPALQFRLRGDAIWPLGGAPIWAPLAEFVAPGTEFGRAEVLAFCERFVIELGLPVASTELTIPGPLERALIEDLTTRVGIGRYPNHGRAPADVAALAISLANLARTQEAALTPADVERELEIRVDFGRVAQSFPLDATLFHDRPTFRRELYEAALAGVHQLVMAPPGAGKSWELTRLADELRGAGAIVARHYCYLEPGDDLVERRVTTDVFFGNLLGELVDDEPELRGAGGARYAAGIAELEAALTKAAALGRPVVLVVDGLDHIARVRVDARGLGDDETDIVERLATLDVPPGVAVVIGSQPGQHLDPLREQWGERLTMRSMPPWIAPDLEALADRHGVTHALAAVGMTNEHDVVRVRASLAERADGNPLYARYLVRGLVTGLQDGTIASPHDWIAEAPAIAGDVAVYYAHLYRAASAEAQAIADLLGAIDFAVTEGELREMLPAFVGAWVPPALRVLAPVLTSVTGQGGVRIFHESFRRFMTQELARQGRSPADVLTPVIDWLSNRGFYEDAKSYRFLLTALRRAGRGAEVLAHTNTTFVSDSVAHAHPLDAVQRNLMLAAAVAAEANDWPALVRCIELHRSAYTCFDEGQNDWREYWATYLALFGPTALAERLLFDGRPTQSASDGLYACALIDDAGGTAPWREYLDLHGSEVDDHSASANNSDPDGELTADEGDALNVVHGRLRLGGRYGVVRQLLQYLRESGNKFKPLFIRRLASRLTRMAGPELVESIACRADPTRTREPRITPRAAAVLRLGLADELARTGNRISAMEAAIRALADADTPELAAACIDYDASPSSALAADPASVPIAVEPGEYLHYAGGVRAWVASVRLLAVDPKRSDAILDAEVQRVNGPGWYRCWLRYVLALARAEAAQRAGRAGDVVGAFAELTRDVHPFTGKPRACDLWPIRRVIHETVAWGLSMLRTEAEWRHALDALTTAAQGTASQLDREDGGPLPAGMLLEVLLPYVADAAGGMLVRDMFEQQVARLEEVGTYYPTHAEYSMRLARMRYSAGDTDHAHVAWRRAAVFLAAYGWRKDVTLFDVIRSAPILSARSRDVALRALADTQPLTNAAVVHTDGRETRHAPNAWVRSVLDVDPAVGIGVLAHTIHEEGGPGSWSDVRGVQDAAERIRDIGDPALIDAVLATQVFQVNHEDVAVETADARLAPVVRLISIDPPLAMQTLRRVAAEVSGDCHRHTKVAAARVMAVAEMHGLPVPRIAPPKTSPKRLERTLQPNPTAAVVVPALRVPPFVPNPTLVDLLAGLRAAGSTRRWDDAGAWDDVVLALGYHLTQFADCGREDDALRLLRFFARDTHVAPSGMEHPLGKLAASLDIAGYDHLATVAYALAYTATRGGGGWLRMGDQAHGHLISRAIELDAPAARQVVADEVAYSLHGGWNNLGSTRHVVERLAGWGEAEVAERAWREAYAVVAHRLPLAPSDGWFARLAKEAGGQLAIDEWSVDEALVALLLARLSEPRLTRKVAALAGVVRAIERRPDAVVAPLRWWLSRNAHVTSVFLVLDALENAEPESFPITTALDDILRGYAASELWGIRRRARELLMRAGLPEVSVSGSGPCEDSDGASGPGSERQRALLLADIGGVLQDVGSLWPLLPSRVAQRLHAHTSGGAHKELAQSRYRLVHGRDGKSYPPTPTLLWEVELFEVALHEALCGLAEYLWTTGQWEKGLEDAVMRRVLPNARLHLGLAASRTARPDWPMAAATTDGLGMLPALSDDDPAYAGWTRLALVERQYVTDPDRPYGAPVEVVTVFAGAVAAPLGESIPPDVLPFKDGDLNDWWWPEAPTPSFPPRIPLGQVVRLTRARDWLGDALVLVPPPEFHAYLGLEVARYAGPLVWTDRSGAPAVALRTWRTRNPEALFAEPVSCEGADLVMRSDVYERATRLYRVPLRELRVVWRRPVADGPAEQ
jgi:hypothetical protein